MKNKILLLGTLLTFSNSFAQKAFTNEEWVRETGSLPTYSHVSSCSLSSGGIVVVSSSVNSNGNSDVLISKYKRSGVLEWEQMYDFGYNTDEFGIKAVLNSNEEIVIGASISLNSVDKNFGLLKFDLNGNFLWAKEWDFNGGADVIADLIIDEMDNIYITGAGQSTTGFSDLITLKYDNDGNLLWNYTYDFSGLHDIGVNLTLKGNYICVAGTSASQISTWDNVTIVLDQINGDWVDDFRTEVPGNGIDRPTAIIKGSNNNIYITGYYIDNGNKNIQLIKLNNSNIIEWIQTFDGGLEDESSSIGVDDSGNIFVCGFKTRNNGFKEYITLKYSETGVLLWQKSYRSQGETGNAVATSLVINDDGSLFVSGTIEESNSKYFSTVWYDSNGNLKHSMNFKNPLGNYETPILVKKDNDLYLSGIKNIAGSRVLSSIRYSYTDRYESYTLVGNEKSHVANQVIAEFNENIINHATINNKGITFGPLSIFVNDVLIDSLNLIYPNVNWAEVETFKIFSNLTTNETISTTRNGHNIEVYPFWTTLLLNIKGENEVNMVSIFNNNFENHINYAQVNSILSSASNDPLFPNQYGLVSTIYPDAHVNIEDAWAIETGKDNVKIGIYDSGIKFDHQDLGGGFGCEGCKVKDGFDYLTNSSLINVSNSGDELHSGTNNGHGTKVAGIIGALRNNNTNISGIAGGNWPYANTGEGVQVDPLNPSTENIGVSLYGFRIFNSSNIATLDNVCNALVEGCLSTSTGYGYGLEIINNSWKMQLNPPYEQNALLMKNCQREIFKNQVVHVASRGNDVGTTINFPSEAEKEFWVINVGGSDLSGNLHPNSGYSGNMDLIAPFSDVLTTTTSNVTNTSISSFNGTSAAAAYVSGTAGLMLSHINDQPNTPNNLAPDDVEFLIQKYAKDRIIGSGYQIGYDLPTGWGLLDAGNTLTHVDKSEYIIKHIEEESILNLTGITPVIGQRTLPANSGLNPGTYLCEIYTVEYNLSNDLLPSDVILNYWPLNSYTNLLRLDQPATFIDRESEISVVNMTLSTGTIKGTVVHIIQNSQGAPQDYWIPAAPGNNVRYGYTLHVQSDYAGNDDLEIDNFQITCSPNPCSDKLNVEFILKNNSNVKFELYDLNGVLVQNNARQQFTIGQHNIEFDVSLLSSGLYFIKTIVNEEITNTKFVKK